MKYGRRPLMVTLAIGIPLLSLLFAVRPASSHCDTLGGPVIASARLALDKGEITPVLKWVKPEQEMEVRAAFAKALAVRSKGAEAKDLADMYFFENLVRVHRAGEGAPYTGLKPADQVEPVIAMADKAMEDGSADVLVKAISNHAAEGIRQRFIRAYEAKKHADESVAAGREFVEEYVAFTHFVERLHDDATTDVSHHGETGRQTTSEHKH